MTTYTMRRVDTHPERGVDMTQVMFDGQARVVNDVITFTKPHWIEGLQYLGYTDVQIVEEPSVEVDSTVEETTQGAEEQSAPVRNRVSNRK